MKSIFDGLTPIKSPNDDFNSYDEAHEYAETIIKSWISGVYKPKNEEEADLIRENIVFYLRSMKAEAISDIFSRYIEFDESEWKLLFNNIEEYADPIHASINLIADDIMKHPTSYIFDGVNLQ